MEHLGLAPRQGYRKMGTLLRNMRILDKDQEDLPSSQFCHQCVMARPNVFLERIVEHWALERAKQKSFV